MPRYCAAEYIYLKGFDSSLSRAAVTDCSCPRVPWTLSLTILQYLMQSWNLIGSSMRLRSTHMTAKCDYVRSKSFEWTRLLYPFKPLSSNSNVRFLFLVDAKSEKDVQVEESVRLWVSHMIPEIKTRWKWKSSSFFSMFSLAQNTLFHFVVAWANTPPPPPDTLKCVQVHTTALFTMQAHRGAASSKLHQSENIEFFIPSLRWMMQYCR